jgi:glycosyltransferase involved in cell wall biosynthesis
MLQDSPELQQQLGENARRAYQERYSWSKMKSRLLELYQAVLTKS